MLKRNKPKTYCGKLGALPPALRLLTKANRWLVWKWIFKKDRWTKPPFRAADPGSHAKSTDKQTWGPYASALATYTKHDDVDGIGFALLNSDVAALDLDDCRDPDSGKITLWARSYVEQAQAIGAYVEVTVSGTGLRIIGIAEGAKAHRKFTKIGEGDCSIEVFRKAERYFAIPDQNVYPFTLPSTFESQWPVHSSMSPRLLPIPNKSPMLHRTRCVCCPGHARAAAHA